MTRRDCSESRSLRADALHDLRIALLLLSSVLLLGPWLSGAHADVASSSSSPTSATPTFSALDGVLYINTNDLLVLFAAPTDPSAGAAATPASTHNVSVFALSQALADEAARAMASEASVGNTAAVALAAERSRSLSAAALLSDNLMALVAGETSRAVGAEASLGLAVTIEASRALGVEASLGRSVLAEQTRAQNIEGSISASVSLERSRAVVAEATISAAVATQQARAVAAEMSLGLSVSAEQTRAQNIESSISAAVSLERSRALAAEASIGVVAASVTAEQSRALVIEGSLGRSVLAEQTRAQNIEGSISASVSVEISRALVAEAALGVTLSGSVAAEQSRAQGVERSLGGSVLVELSRALGVEASLGRSVAVELSRATVAEAAISVAVGAEQTRAVSVENSLAGRLTGALSSISSLNAQQWRTLLNMPSSFAACTGQVARTTISGVPLCGRSTTTAGCFSMFLNPGGAYTQVQGWLTLLQFGSADGFGDTTYIGGDGVTIWSGTDLIWAYTVGGYAGSASTSNCPLNGGSVPSGASANLVTYSCGSGNYGPTWSLTLYLNPLFGPGSPFFDTVASTTSNVEVRICLDQGRNDEDLYIAAGVIEVR